MPKKTKRQKLLAELHKKLAASSSYAIPVKTQINPDASNNKNISISGIKYNNYPSIKPKTSNIQSDYSYITADLIRITIFTIIAFILQGVLYFQLHRS